MATGAVTQVVGSHEECAREQLATTAREASGSNGLTFSDAIAMGRAHATLALVEEVRQLRELLSGKL